MLYKYENGTWQEFDLEIDGTIPKYIEIKVNKCGKIRYAITEGTHCSIKNEYDGEMVIKKISNKTEDKTIQEKHCKLDVVIATDENCFTYTESNNKIKIASYNCYKGNTTGNQEITDVIIPEQIEGKTVEEIGGSAFKNKSLTSVIFPNSLETIGGNAFSGTGLESVTIPGSVKTIGDSAFELIGLRNLNLGA